MTKMNEIKKMKDDELTAFVNEKREAIRANRFGTGAKDGAAAGIARKEIARALTELQARHTGSSNTLAE